MLNEPPFTPALCRMGRAALDWPQAELSAAADVALSTIRDFEAEKRKPRARTLTALRRALETRGVRFGREVNHISVSIPAI
jgi:hypothetical protein